jgi:hypothetical protein
MVALVMLAVSVDGFDGARAEFASGEGWDGGSGA